MFVVPSTRHYGLVCVCVCVCLCSLSVKCQPSRHLGSHPEMNLSLTPMLCIVTASQANFNRISWISEGKCKFKQDPICWSYLYIGNWLRRDKQMHQFYSQVPLKDNLVSDFQFLSPTKQEKKTLTVHMGAKDDNITLCHTLILLLSMCMWSLAHQSAGLCGSKKKKAPGRHLERNTLSLQEMCHTSSENVLMFCDQLFVSPHHDMVLCSGWSVRHIQGQQLLRGSVALSVVRKLLQKHKLMAPEAVCPHRLLVWWQWWKVHLLKNNFEVLVLGYLHVLLLSTPLLFRHKTLLFTWLLYFVITFKNHIFTIKTTLLIATYLHTVLLVYKSQHIYWKSYSVEYSIGSKLNCNFEFCFSEHVIPIFCFQRSFGSCFTFTHNLLCGWRWKWLH